jgi:hypothetical protein
VAARPAESDRPNQDRPIPDRPPPTHLAERRNRTDA